jgi:hypothetical protein
MSNLAHIVPNVAGAEHTTVSLPDECRESCGNIARSLMRQWRKDNWNNIETMPDLCRAWLDDLTRMDYNTFDDDQICTCAISLIMGGRDLAEENLTEFLGDWIFRQKPLR